ncbi:MAG: hypothetical protein RIF36_00400 [Imperialibacter sp.]|uniref:hypothetical protein n=1 Tax=Imperialibacter sp. TaxID=2038411 RepID=UPI0032EC2E66
MTSNKYEDKIYEFFSMEENFKTMVKVASHLDVVSKRLIREFWELLKEQLKEKMKEERRDFIVDFSGRFDDKWTKLWIYKKEWPTDKNGPLIAVAFQALDYGGRPFVGIFVDIENNQYKTDSIKSLLRGKKKLKDYDSNDPDDPWWVIWQMFPFEFTSHEKLYEILPETRQSALDKVIAVAFDMLDAIEEEMPTALREAKKWQRGK